MKKRVLCLTHSGDFYVIERVMEEMENLGLSPLRMDTDKFPRAIDLSINISDKEEFAVMEQDSFELDTRDVKGVWLRKLWQADLGEELDANYRGSCINESGRTLDSWLGFLDKVPWVDPPAFIRAGENKVSQLQVARASGLKVPDTLIGNSAEGVRNFYRKHKGEIITKMLTPISVSMDASKPFLYTSKVEKEDLEALEGLKYCPMIFQKLINKQCEYRVIYVDGDIFVGGIDAKESLKGKVDWRLSRPDECQWQEGDLPEDVKDGLRVFMKKMNLIYGAIDIIKTVDGEHIFLEVNPSGEWGMIEMSLGLPISRGIAKSFKKRIEE